MKIIKFILVYIFFPVLLFSQKNLPPDYFTSPLPIPLKPAALFGDIRPNHFHSGCDLSTNGLEGMDVYSAADGYISRIKIAPGGYGNALYITHPGGYVTVYGHLRNYREDIQKYIRKNQYEKESFEIELFPPREMFPVKKGDFVAKSGNTGNSFGAHLHFEVRDSASEMPINPMLFSFNMPDKTAPHFTGIKVYPIHHEGLVDGKDEAAYFTIYRYGAGYRIAHNGPFQLSGRIGFGIIASDKIDDDPGDFGIFGIEMLVDHVFRFMEQKDVLSFDETRGVNDHIDYQSYKTNYTVIEKCFQSPNGHLMMNKSQESGLVFFNDTLAHSATIMIKDVRGNTATLDFDIQSSPFNIKVGAQNADHVFLWNVTDSAEWSTSKNQASQENFKVKFPIGSLFDTLYFHWSVENYTYSKLFHLSDPFIPLKSAYTLSIEPNAGLTPELQPKALIVAVDKSGNRSGLITTYENGFLITKPVVFGDFYVDVDTEPPTIEELAPNADGMFQFKIADALSGIKSYPAVLTDKWILMNLDGKTGILTQAEKIDIPENSHLVLTVTDQKDNVKVLSLRLR